MSDRWATFDCYGTIADWHGGMREALREAVGDDADRLLEAYHRHEPIVEAERPHRLYRDVLREALVRGAAEDGLESRPGRGPARARLAAHAVPRRRARRARAPARRGLAPRGADQLRRRPVGHHRRTPARRLRPGRHGAAGAELQARLGHFERFRETTGVADEQWVHVACSWFHDMQAARELGIRRVWVDRDRTGEDPAIANAVLHDFTWLPETLADVLGQPVPAAAGR